MSAGVLKRWSNFTLLVTLILFSHSSFHLFLFKTWNSTQLLNLPSFQATGQDQNANDSVTTYLNNYITGVEQRSPGKKAKSMILCKINVYSLHSEALPTICQANFISLYAPEPPPPKSISLIATNQNRFLPQKSSRTSISVKFCIWQLVTEPRNKSGLNKIKVSFLLKEFWR